MQPQQAGAAEGDPGGAGGVSARPSEGLARAQARGEPMRHFLAGPGAPPAAAERGERAAAVAALALQLPAGILQQPPGAAAAAGEPGCSGRAGERCAARMETPRRARRAGAGGGALLPLLLPPLLLLGWGAAQELNPRGRNVCSASGSAGSVCCPGWKQLGEECLIAVCEGNFTCKDNEVCVRPNECRCRHGYFGANCETKCPRQFWGPDCKEMCWCHPNGQCEDVTGQCTCNANRWGPKCENACLCKHGKCDQKTGRCTCEPSFWGPQCSNNCYCSLNSQCDQQTGACLCQPGWWGRNCMNQCACSNSPCEQFSGRCQCRGRTFGLRCDRYCQCHMGRCNQVDGTCTCDPGYRGKFCREPCPAGFYGQGCRRRCGQCKGLQPCTIMDGRCLACEAGWNGTKCDQICSSGFYGEGCEQNCPPCKDGHTCNHINGKCSHCNPGWIGDRCETRCRNGTYGENCAFVCSDCFNGECHFETGKCLCRAGFHGISCNLTCPTGQYGVNCEESCSCHEDSCDPLTGSCHMEANQRMGVVGAAALLALLLILLLSLLCCCCVCRKKDHTRDTNQDLASKKSPRRLCGRFSRIGMKLPRIPLRRQKLPKVVVAHHDLENTMNCSFIEPPSVLEQPSPSWSSRGSFSSFDTTDEGPVYCVPHEESVSDSKDKFSATCNLVEKMAPPISEEEAGEYTILKESSSTQADSETPLLKSSDSERSSCGSSSASGALYARIARLSKQSRDDDENALESKSAKPPSPERAKPPPPDPSTKPKVSWIHSKYNSNQSNSLPAIGMADSMEAKQGLAKRKRSPSETSAGVHGKADEKAPARCKEKAPKHPKELSSLEGKGLAAGSGDQPSPSRPKQRHKASPEQMENINGAVQSVIKKRGSYPPERKGGDAPKSPNHSKPRSEGLHPHLASEAVTLLNAQLKEKTQSLNRADGGTRQNGVSPLPAQREKPTPPQKAKRSVATSGQKSSKAVLPTSPNLQKLISPVAEAPAGDARKVEKPGPGSNPEPAPASGEPAVKKTPIKKPPRKKSREVATDQPKAPMMPPQTVQ
ncbi:scavenger receptor class F member 2 isoform X1 [Hemicordylus capensis]|uniref:scavenger receptor class F member 2 isoform X1 n=1 Tax=Hemicordylus capensis TaxID=884348 RepID=UPI00230329F7|nr:scavenger receptor class F member 2 isoform X1 [Hemicordylus capensis]